MEKETIKTTSIKKENLGKKTSFIKGKKKNHYKIIKN